MEIIHCPKCDAQVMHLDLMCDSCQLEYKEYLDSIRDQLPEEWDQYGY